MFLECSQLGNTFGVYKVSETYDQPLASNHGLSNKIK